MNYEIICTRQNYQRFGAVVENGICSGDELLNHFNHARQLTVLVRELQADQNVEINEVVEIVEAVHSNIEITEQDIIDANAELDRQRIERKKAKRREADKRRREAKKK